MFLTARQLQEKLNEVYLNKNYIELTMIKKYKEPDIAICYEYIASDLVDMGFVESISIRSIKYCIDSKHINFRLLVGIVNVLDLDVEKVLIRKEK